MTKIIMDEMKRTREALRALLLKVQEGCRLMIRLAGGEEDMAPLLARVSELEEESDGEMTRITGELADIVGKLYLAGLLKRAVVCDAVVAHGAEAMLDTLQSVAATWRELMDSEPGAVTHETRLLLDSMLQNCVVMIEKTVDILDGKDSSETALAFIRELDRNVNQANLTAHEALLGQKGDRRSILRLIRVFKNVEVLGDKIKSAAMYLLFIRTGEFIKV